MTRYEFYDMTSTIGELVDFCRENGYEDEVDGIIDSEELNNWIENDISGDVRSEGWEWVRNALGGIPTGYDWYRCNALYDAEGITDFDYSDLRDDILERCISDGVVVEDDEYEFLDDELEEDYDSEDDCGESDTDADFLEFVSASFSSECAVPHSGM